MYIHLDLDLTLHLFFSLSQDSEPSSVPLILSAAHRPTEESKEEAEGQTNGIESIHTYICHFREVSMFIPHSALLYR